jgi:hypothetical protein
MRKPVLIFLGALLATGCSTEPRPTQGENMQDHRATLQQRPSIEEITARYNQMQQKLRDRLSTEIGSLTWSVSDPLSRAGCADFTDVQEAESRVLDSWKSEGNLPDADWPRAVAILREVTAEYGFAEPEAIVDRPSDHEVQASDGFGARYQFGTANNTLLMLSTGCHLPQAAKQGQG